MTYPNWFKLASFISQETGRRFSDVVRAMEDGRSQDISAWATEATDKIAEALAEQSRIDQEIQRRVTEATEWDGKRRKLMERVDAQIRILCNKIDGPLGRKETRKAWLTEHGWNFTADNICEKNGYSCKAYNPSPYVTRRDRYYASDMEIIFQLEEEGGIEGEYRKLYWTDFNERLRMNGIVQRDGRYVFADPREEEFIRNPSPETNDTSTPN